MATNMMTPETVNASTIAIESGTRRRAVAAAFILLTFIIWVAMCAPGAGAAFKAYGVDASSSGGVVSVDGKDYYAPQL